VLFRKCLGVSLCLKERTPAPSRQSEGSFRARARNPVRGCFASLSMTIAMSFRTPSRVMPSTFFGHCERQRGIHNIVCHGKSGFFTTLRSVQNDETENPAWMFIMHSKTGCNSLSQFRYNLQNPTAVSSFLGSAPPYSKPSGPIIIALAAPK